MGGYRDYQHLQCELSDPGILRIMFANPGRMNAVTQAQHTELARIFRDIDADPDVRVVLVTGADDTFSAGGDIRMIEGIVNDWEARVKGLKEVRDIVYGIIDCSKPIVSAMAGPAVGAGLSVGLLADISIVTPDARIIDGHLRLGVAAGDHAVLVWPLLCGMAKAKYHLLTGASVSGEEAERMGLVSLCVPKDALQDRALEIARSLANGPREAISWTKLALNGWFRSAGANFDVSLAYEVLGFAGPEGREGLAALREKRSPDFATSGRAGG
jgi:enoyl-CoA hydratase